MLNLMAVLGEIVRNQLAVALVGVFLSTHQAEWRRNLQQSLRQKIACLVHEPLVSLRPVVQVSEDIPEFNERVVCNTRARQEGLNTLVSILSLGVHLSPRETPSASLDETNSTFRTSLGEQSWQGRRLMLDRFRLDVAVKRRTAGESANRSFWPGVIWLSPLPLRRHPLIAMMQSAQDRRGDQPGGAGDRSIGLRLGNRRVAIESLVRPGRMVVLLDEFPQQSLQVALAQDDHVVQKLSA